MAKNNLDFEDFLPAIQVEIEKRRGKWVLSTLDYEDVSQMIVIRIFNKFHTFDPEKGPFQNWVNRLISNAIRNILRDNLMKFSRPCLSCAKNLGDDFCSYTKSKKQCIECPLYKRWKDKKEQHFNVKASLSLENHMHEAQNMINDFVDIGRCKSIIDEKMKQKLSEEEYKIYSLIYIQNKPMEEVGKILEYKKLSSNPIPGYQQLLKVKKKMVLLAKEIIKEEGLA